MLLHSNDTLKDHDNDKEDNNDHDKWQLSPAIVSRKHCCYCLCFSSSQRGRMAPTGVLNRLKSYYSKPEGKFYATAAERV